MNREEKIEVLETMIEKEKKAVERLKTLPQTPYMDGRIERAEISVQAYELLLWKLRKGDVS